jgi:hypothetical protein
MYPPQLRNDIGSFFERLFPHDSKIRHQNGKLFDAMIDSHARHLLNERVGLLTDKIIADCFAECPELGLEVIQLYTRAIASKTQSLIMENRIDVRRMLSERLRLIKAKRVVNTYRRRII